VDSVVKLISRPRPQRLPCGRRLVASQSQGRGNPHDCFPGNPHDHCPGNPHDHCPGNLRRERRGSPGGSSPPQAGTRRLRRPLSLLFLPGRDAARGRCGSYGGPGRPCHSPTEPSKASFSSCSHSRASMPQNELQALAVKRLAWLFESSFPHRLTNFSGSHSLPIAPTDSHFAPAISCCQSNSAGTPNPKML
jgi:hypothetical protein